MKNQDLARKLISRLNAGKLSHDDLVLAGVEVRKVMRNMMNLGLGSGELSEGKTVLTASLKEIARHG